MGGVIAADTGGTFTDLVTLSEDGSRLLIAKALTTYDDPTRGLMACVEQAGANPATAEAFKFGTTLVINAFLQRKGARTAMLCTRGFRDSIEIRRGNRAFPFDVRYQRDAVLVPRALRLEVDERIDAAGQVLKRVDPAEVEALARQLAEEKVEAVAVSFVNAYRNAENEARAVEILRRCLPGTYITSGSELTREWYEYERASTAAANGYVGPTLDHFLDQMEATLHTAGFRRSIYLMASNGGVLSLGEARRQPVQLVESGPVGGCIGAAVYAGALGLDKVIAFDMGGTTAKCALIEKGGFETRSPYYVGGDEHGFPIRGAVIDILEVGAGGGSIAGIDAQQRLTVGPNSAGSTPGPACYGRGGAFATVTDANVALGRIGAASFGGGITLDKDAAEAAIMANVGTPLGYLAGDIDHVAQGIIDIGTLTMGSAIAKITTERGLDPRDFSLFVFGGGGPVHGVDLARHIGIPHLIVPPQPGLFSAVGMLMAKARIDESRTFVGPMSEDIMRETQAAFADMEAIANGRLPDDGGEDGEAIVERWADLRYVGQRHAMRTPLGGATDAGAIRAVFADVYRARFGYADPDAPLEFVALGVSVSRPVSEVTPALLTPRTAAARTQATSRDIYFKRAGRRIATPVVQRDQLSIGETADGPLIVEEYGSSTILGPGDRLEVGAYGELNIQVELDR